MKFLLCTTDELTFTKYVMHFAVLGTAAKFMIAEDSINMTAEQLKAYNITVLATIG